MPVLCQKAFTSLLCFLFLFPVENSVNAQVRWDGGGGDGQWTTAANWVGDMLPVATDDVVLDNSVVSGSYMVLLPSGTNSVTVRTLQISPAPGDTIELQLPASSTAIPAFTATGPGYGLVLNPGGIFRNASGASSGAPVAIADSIRINNGGWYKQNTQRSHAGNVTVLSRAPGTEEGIFEFDIPDASTTIALNDRTFGKLLFSSVAAGGIVTYAATGTKPVIVNSDLEIREGVTLTLNFSDTLFVRRNWQQQGGDVNLGNSTRRLVAVIGGNMYQSAAGIIRETGTAIPEILLSGTAHQQVDCSGMIADSITLTVDNPAGISLLSSLSLPYALRLNNGIINTTTALLTLQPGCTLQADSSSNNSFINGPMRKEGMTGTGHFLFPVGKDNAQRWLTLQNAAGNFTVEFIKANPQTLSTGYGTGIDHTSALEYWTITPDSDPTPSAAVELSFNDPNSGGVTDMTSLRVAQLSGGTWVDAGNTAVTGTPGSQGSVTGNMVSLFEPGINYFTLASSTGIENPLPVLITMLSAYRDDETVLEWKTADKAGVTCFEVQAASAGNQFIPAGKVYAAAGRNHYRFVDLKYSEATRYRLRLVSNTGQASYSRIVSVTRRLPAFGIASYSGNSITLSLTAVKNASIQLQISMIDGRTIRRWQQSVMAGSNTLPVDISGLIPGVYTISIYHEGKQEVMLFVK